MAYSKIEWNSGDVITAEKLNHIEKAVEDVSSSVDDMTPSIAKIDNIESTVEDLSAEIVSARNYNTSGSANTLGGRIDELVRISNTQPGGNNEIWVNSNENTIIRTEVPTYQEFNNLIVNQSTQPSAESNRIWIPTSDGEEFEVPEMDEINDINHAAFYNGVTLMSEIWKNSGSLEVEYAGLLGVTGKWGSLGTGKHVLLPVSPGDSVYIKANSKNPTVYGVLKNYTNVVSGQDPFYSEDPNYNTRQSLSAKTETETPLIMPSDAKYLCLNKEFINSGTTYNYIPAILSINGYDAFIGTRKAIATETTAREQAVAAEVSAREAADNDLKSALDYVEDALICAKKTINNASIDASGVIVGSSSTLRLVCFQVKAGTKITVTGTFDLYGFFENEPEINQHTYNNSRTLSPTISNYTVPAGCRWIAVRQYTSDNDAVISPTSKVEDINLNLATEYDNLTWPVSAGQYCLHEEMVYVANQDIPTLEGWNASHWTRTNLGDGLSDLGNVQSDIIAEATARETADNELKNAFDIVEENTTYFYDTGFRYNLVTGIINSSGDIVTGDKKTTDYIEAEAGKDYLLFTQDDGVYSPLIVAFYSSKSTAGFISRINRNSGEITKTFTTPANTQFVRITSFGSAFPDKLWLSKNSELLFPWLKQSNNTTQMSLNSDMLFGAVTAVGIKKYRNLLYLPHTINTEGVWAISSYKHIMIPINAGDQISVTPQSGKYAIYTTLSDAWFVDGQSPHYAYVYKDDEEEQTTYDVRNITNKQVSFKCGQNAKYLYITATYDNGNEIVDSVPFIAINGVPFGGIETIEQTGETDNYTTVFFDDFNSFDENIWMMHTEPEPVAGTALNYRSRFYTNSDNVRVENSMLIMKVAEGNSGHNGTYIDEDGNIQSRTYLAPYISTALSFAMPHGRISARLKTSKVIGKDFFMWAFWTFGQNAAHAYAHEMDIIEGLQKVLTSELTYEDGTVVPAGSIQSYYRTAVHGTTALGVRTSKQTEEIIKVSCKSGSSFDQDKIMFISNRVNDNFETDDWHVYSVEWDESNVTFFIDGGIVLKTTAEAMGATDGNGNVGFVHPQDIRFNIKCKVETSDVDGYLFVDWVKAECAKATPCLVIDYDDMAISVGQTVFIDPDFNTDCSNHAFVAESDDESIAKVRNITDSSQLTVHQVTGITAGETDISIISPTGAVRKTVHVVVS